MRSASTLNQIHASADELAECFSAEQSVLEQGKVDELRNDGILFAVVRPNFFASVLLSGECFIHLFVLFFVVVGQFVILFVLRTTFLAGTCSCLSFGACIRSA